MDINTRRYNDLLSACQKAYFDMNKQLQFERAQKVWREVKDDTMKYEETVTELKRKGQIRKSKQRSYWSILKPNILNKTVSESS